MSQTFPQDIPSPKPPVALDAMTGESLRGYRRRRGWLLGVRGFAAALVVWFLGVVSIAIADGLWWWEDGIRWSVSLGLYLLAGWAAWRWGLREIRRDDPRDLARRIEDAEPRLRGQLLAAVELADPEWANGSPALLARLQRRVAQRIGATPIERLLPTRLVRHWLLAVAWIVGIIAFLSFWPSLEFGRRLARAALPGLPVERASLTKLRIVRPDPPSRRVAEGDTVGVVAEVGGRPVETAILHWQSDDGSRGEVGMLPRDDAAMQMSDASTPVRDRFVESNQRSQVAANLAVRGVPVRYRVTAGDAVTRWHTLSPHPRPRVASFQIRYRYPEYARLPDRVVQTDTGDLEALAGTTAEVTVGFDLPVRDALARFGSDGVEINLEAADEQGLLFRGSIPIRTPGVYQLDATSREADIDNPFSPQYAITPVADSPPVVEWAESVRRSRLVSPLEVVNLRGAARDDVPLDEMRLDFEVNGGETMRRMLPVDSPSRRVEVDHDWDLLRLHDETPTRLSPGDQIRVQLVAIDRRGQIGRSPPVRLLVVDDGFDPGRHDSLHRLGEWTEELLAWTEPLRAVTTEIETLRETVLADERTPAGEPDPGDPAREAGDRTGGTGRAAAFAAASQAIGRSVANIRENRDPTRAIRSGLEELLAAASRPPETNSLEQIGIAILETDDRIARLVFLLSGFDPELDTDGKPSTDAWLEQARELAAIRDHLENFARARLSHEVVAAIYRDQQGLLASLDRLIAEQRDISLERFPRHLQVLQGRLRAIDRLAERYAESLLPETRDHQNDWFRFSDRWSAELDAAVEGPPDPNRWRTLIGEFRRELENESRQGISSAELIRQWVDAADGLENHSGRIAERIREIRALGERWADAENRPLPAEPAARALASRAQARRIARLDHAIRAMADRIEATESLHRRRPQVDLAFAADLKLLGRAWRNVTRDGYQPFGDEPAADVFEHLAWAMQRLEPRHRIGLRLAELQAIVSAERFGQREDVLRVDHPLRISHLPTGIRRSLDRLRATGIGPENLERIGQAVAGDGFTQTRDAIAGRRWQADPPLPRDEPLSQIARTFKLALDSLGPEMEEARRRLSRYVASLPEQARQAAEQAEAARDAAEQARSPEPDSPDADAPEDRETADPRPSDDPPRPEDGRDPTEAWAREPWGRDHEEAQRAAQETVDSLVDLANNLSLIDQAQRELGRDADAAAAAIRDAMRQADGAVREASETAGREAAGDPQASPPADPPSEAVREALDRAAEAQQQLADALRRTADHFERAEAGEPLEDSRESLRGEQPMRDASDLDDLRQDAERFAEQAAQSPEEQLRQLEEELRRNPPMQESLDDIAERGAEVALRSLQRSAREEQQLERSLENSDGELLERKRTLRQRLRDLASQARDLEDHLLGPAERAANWSNDPESRPLFQTARKELSTAAEQVDRLRDDAAPLDEMRQIADRLARAMRAADERLRQTAENARRLRDDDLHGNADRRDRTADDMLRIARESRRDLARQAHQRGQQWGRETARAERAIADAQRRQRQAEQRRERAATRLGERPDDESARREARQAERQIERERQVAEAAQESRRWATEQQEQAKRSGESIATRELAPLERANPAAELTERLSTEAVDTLDSLRERLAQWDGDAVRSDTLRVPAESMPAFDRNQRAIHNSVVEAAEQLRRAARHQDRLGQPQAAEALAAAADAVAGQAAAATQAARRSLADARDDEAQSPEARQALGRAAKVLQAQADSLSQTLAGLPPSSLDQAADSDDRPDPGEARRLAQTLDELDRALFGQAAGDDASDGPPEGSEPGEPAPGDPEGPGEPADGDAGDAGDGSPTGESGPSRDAAAGQDPSAAGPSTAADASPTMQSMLDEQAQATARGRHQFRDLPEDAADQPAGDESLMPGTPGDIDGGPIAIEGIDRAGSGWGQLRERRTEEVAEGRRELLPPQYRLEIEAYFRAVARQAGQRQRDRPDGEDAADPSGTDEDQR